jgi:hypothetical protein
MAKCQTCGKTIRINKGWSIGASARKHYWRHHPEVMMAKRIDKEAENALPKKIR